MLTQTPTAPTMARDFGARRPFGDSKTVQQLYNSSLWEYSSSDKESFLLGASSRDSHPPTQTYNERRAAEIFLDRNSATDDWFTSGAEEPLPKITQDNEDSNDEKEEEALEAAFEDDSVNCFICEKPHCFQRSTETNSGSDSERPFSRGGPLISSTSEMSRAIAPHAPAVGAEVQNGERRPTRPRSSVSSWGCCGLQSSSGSRSSILSFEATGLKGPKSTTVSDASSEQKDDITSVYSLYSMELPSPLPEGRGPFWEKFKSEDFSNYKKPESMTRDELLKALKQKEKHIFELEIAASRDSWKVNNAEEELFDLDNALQESTEKVASLERKVELLSSYLAIAGSELRGMKEKRAVDCKRLTIAQQQIKKIYMANAGYCACGSKRKFVPEITDPSQSERAKKNMEDYVNRRISWEERMQRFRMMR